MAPPPAPETTASVFYSVLAPPPPPGWLPSRSEHAGLPEFHGLILHPADEPGTHLGPGPDLSSLEDGRCLLFLSLCSPTSRSEPAADVALAGSSIFNKLVLRRRFPRFPDSAWLGLFPDQMSWLCLGGPGLAPEPWKPDSCTLTQPRKGGQRSSRTACRKTSTCRSQEGRRQSRQGGFLPGSLSPEPPRHGFHLHLRYRWVFPCDLGLPAGSRAPASPVHHRRVLQHTAQPSRTAGGVHHKVLEGINIKAPKAEVAR